MQPCIGRYGYQNMISHHPKLAEQVHTQLERMYALVEKIHAGQCRGATGEVIQRCGEYWCWRVRFRTTDGESCLI